MTKKTRKRELSARMITSRKIKYSLLAGGITVNSSMGIELKNIDGKLKRWVAFRTGDGRWQIKVGPFDMSELSIVQLKNNDIEILSDHKQIEKLVIVDTKALELYTDEDLGSGHDNQ